MQCSRAARLQPPPPKKKQGGGQAPGIPAPGTAQPGSMKDVHSTARAEGTRHGCISRRSAAMGRPRL